MQVSRERRPFSTASGTTPYNKLPTCEVGRGRYSCSPPNRHKKTHVHFSNGHDMAIEAESCKYRLTQSPRLRNRAFRGAPRLRILSPAAPTCPGKEFTQKVFNLATDGRRGTLPFALDRPRGAHLRSDDQIFRQPSAVLVASFRNQWTNRCIDLSECKS